MSRRLLVRAGGSSTMLRTLQGFVVTSSPNGGWTVEQDPKAFYYNGAAYLAWCNGSSGDVAVAKWTDATATLSSPFTLKNLGADTHNAPSIIVRTSDRKILVAYCGHDVNQMFVRVSSSAEDVTSFAAEVNIDATLGSSDYTYPELFQLDNGDIYLFWRDISGSTGRLAYSKSTDGGATWAARTVLYTGGSAKVPYWRINTFGGDRFDIAVTDDSPYDATSALGHFYLTSSGRFKSDGTSIATALPIGYSDIAQVQSNASGSVWSFGTSKTAETEIAILSSTNIGSENSIRRHTWNGSSWTTSTLTGTGGRIAADTFGPGATIHPRNPDIAYVGKVAAGQSEMYRYVYSGGVWTGTAVTSGSSSTYFSPDFVRDGPSSIEAIVNIGTITSPTSYSFGVRGFGFR